MRTLPVLLLILFTPVFLQAQTSKDKPGVEVPPADIGATTIEARKQEQLKTAGQLKVFHDFTFSDRLADTGITFRHFIVDDAGRHYKPVHYDHGNGRRGIPDRNCRIETVDGAAVRGGHVRVGVRADRLA